MSDLAARIAAKKAEGLSLRDAGKASGVAFSTLGRIEGGAEPSYRVAGQIEAWLRGEAPPLPPPPMTLRDWFAGQASKAPPEFFHPDQPSYKDVNGDLNWNDANQRRWQLAVNDWIVAREVAWRSAFADAMLAERERQS